MTNNKGYYGPQDVIIDYISKLNDPGKYPFTRGIYPTMYRTSDGGRKPTIRQFAGHGLADDTNLRFRRILELGGTGLSTAFDLPTLMGRDSDDPIAEGQVGWDGVAIDTLADMEDLFKNIPRDDITVSMTINAPAAVMLAMYIVAAEKSNFQISKLGGTTQNDILKEYIAQKEWLYPVDKGVKLVTDTIEYCSQHMPQWHPVSISGYHIREAGATAAQELAYTLVNGTHYVSEALKRGLSLNSFAPQLSFFFDIHNDFFEEIAKLRAARKLWAQIMHEQFGATDNKSMWCRIHAQTAGCTLTRQEPINNIIRVAYQALAALLGGVQSIHTNSYDEVVCTPTERALKIAVRTQQILLEETEITNWIDPLGGSWLIEQLTDGLTNTVHNEILEIEKMGGIEKAIERQYPQRKIHESAVLDQHGVELGGRKIVGVNYQHDIVTNDTTMNEIASELTGRNEFFEKQLKRLGEVKKSRSNTEVAKALNEIQRSAEENLNMMPSIISAVKSYATIGEISQAMQNIWGKYQEHHALSKRISQNEIRVMIRSLKFAYPVRILLAKAGLDGHTRGILILADLLRTMGAEVIYLGLHHSIEEIAKAAVEEDVAIIGLSALIGSPAVLFTSLKTKLIAYGRNDILVTGGGIILPEEQVYLEQELGIGKIFPPDTSYEEIAKYLCMEVNNHER